MEVPTAHEDKQKEATPNGVEEIVVQAASAPGVSRGESASTSTHRQASGQAKPARRDQYAEKRLARKKKMRAAHRRRLNASHAKG
jgi:hypothetical protein